MIEFKEVKTKAQITTAAGDGTVAAFFVRDYLAEGSRRADPDPMEGS